MRAKRLKKIVSWHKKTTPLYGYKIQHLENKESQTFLKVCEIIQVCLHFLTIAKPLAKIGEIHLQPVWPTKIVFKQI